MSWLFGILLKNKHSNFNFELHEEFQKAELDNLFVAVNTDSKTAFIKSTPTIITAYVGVPILEKNSKKKLFNESSFHNLNSINPEDLYGHFVWLNYSNKTLKIFTDVFGLRELYYIDSDDRLIFSTRIDLLSNYYGNIKIDLKEFSTFWLTNFQLSHNSILTKIKRLGPGGEISFNNSKLEITNKKFSKSFIQEPSNRFAELVTNYCSIEDNKKTISLGLSGGIDARLILASAFKTKNVINCHTLVNEEDKDLKIATEICKTLNLNHTLLPRKKINLADYNDEILKLYRNIPPKITLTQLLDFSIYGKEYLQNHISLDGGFGEFYRNQYLSKIFFKGFSKFNLKEAENIKNILYAPKPQIFKDEVHFQLENSINEFVEELILSFPAPKNKEELAEILDLSSVKFMLPNVYSPGQIILDQNFISFMPLTQKDTINNGINISLSYKSDSKLFKKIISASNRKLSRINLVKNNLANPFWLNNKLVMLRLVLDRILKKQNNFERYKVLYNSKEYILDLLNDSDTKNNNYLSYKEDFKVAGQFFNGNLSKGYYLDWLLTFVLWSKANKIC